jgi:hypothetical protein
LRRDSGAIRSTFLWVAEFDSIDFQGQSGTIQQKSVVIENVAAEQDIRFALMSEHFNGTSGLSSK